MFPTLPIKIKILSNIIATQIEKTIFNKSKLYTIEATTINTHILITDIFEYCFNSLLSRGFSLAGIGANLKIAIDDSNDKAKII